MTTAIVISTILNSNNQSAVHSEVAEKVVLSTTEMATHNQSTLFLVAGISIAFVALCSVFIYAALKVK